MLVLHPRSCCDVCLEPYSQHSIARSPHALPCGHVFCKQCLDSIRPPNCPLCRGHFMPDRLKKLFVDEPRDADDRLLAEENEFLRTLMLFWDGSDGDLVNWTRQVDSWLEGRAGTHAALNKARAALAEYQKLKTRRERDKLTIKALKERDKVHVAERDDTQAIEQSLVQQISHLEAKLTESEKVRQALQTQVARHKLKNPLPHPPEVPVPLEQLSTTVAASHTSGSTSLYTVPEAGPSSSRRQSHNNGSIVQPDPRFLTPFYVPVPNSQPPSQPHPPENERDRKGKRKAKEGYGRHSVASVYPDAHSFLAPSSHPNGVLSDDERGVIVPGAVTQRRVIPPKEVTLSNTPFLPSSNEGEDYSNSREGTSSYDPAASLNPYSLAALYIGEYVNGYGEGYSAATNLNSQSPQGVGSSHIYNASGEGQTSRDAWRHDSTEGAALVPRNSSEPHSEREPRQAGRSTDQENESGEERLVYNVHRLGHRSSTSRIHADGAQSSTDHVENGHIMNSSHPSTNIVNGASHSRPHRSHRRRTSGFVPGHETDVESARRARDDPMALPFQRPSSVSVSSWIHPPVATTATTIATASHVNITRTRAAQSTASGLNELGLSTFGPDSMYPNPPGGTPRSTLSSLGLHSFPLREDDEIVMERLPSANPGSNGSTGRAAQETTPRPRTERHVSFDRRPAFIGGGVGTTAVGLGQATIATSTISAIVTTNANPNEPTGTSRNAQRRSGRHTTSIDHTSHGSRNTTTSARSSSAALVPTSAVPAPPAVTILGSPSMEDAMHLSVPEMPRPLPRTPPRFRNALGLQLEVSGDTTPTGGISAPMPIVSAERFLRSWSLGDP